MSKKAVMISIDEHIHKKAQEKMLNISQVCEKALRFNTEPSIKDVKEEQLKSQCVYCGQIFTEGYICEIAKDFSCKECEYANKENNNTKYPCSIKEDHEHNPIPPFTQL